MRKKDTAFSVVILLISACLTVQAFQYPDASSQFPRFICVLMVFFAALMTAASIRRSRGSDEIRSAGFIADIKIPAIVLAATALYVAGMMYVGYFVSTACFMAAMMFVFGQRQLMPMIVAIGAFIGVVYALFVSFLGLRLPAGILF